METTPVNPQNPDNPLPWRRLPVTSPAYAKAVKNYHKEHRIRGLEPTPMQWLIEEGFHKEQVEKISDPAFLMMEIVHRRITGISETEEQKRLDPYTLFAITADDERELVSHYYDSIQPKTITQDEPLPQLPDVEPKTRPLTSEEVTKVGQFLIKISQLENIEWSSSSL